MSDLLTNCIADFNNRLEIMKKIQDYYTGKTDLDTLFKVVTGRNNVKVHINLFKKFVKEQSNYLCANDITYTSTTNDAKGLAALKEHIDTWDEATDLIICRNMVKFSESYELYYVGDDAKVKSRILTPLNCYVLTDEFGEKIQLAIHFFKKKFDTTQYYDVYYPDKIEHYNGGEKLEKDDINYFKEVPITIYKLSQESTKDTIYNDIKNLQDGLEIIASNILNESSDFRNSYLKLKGCGMEDDEVDKAKDKGLFILPNGDCDLDFIIKNINDAFIQNLLKFFREQIYTLGCMIDHNEELTSNSSSLALKTRLISVTNAVKLSEKAMKNGIKKRIRLIYVILSELGKEYNYLNIKSKFTPLIPSDDLMMAQIISQVPDDYISKETGRKQFSFISDPQLEAQKVKEEQEEINLDNIPPGDDEDE